MPIFCPTEIPKKTHFFSKHVSDVSITKVYGAKNTPFSLKKRIKNVKLYTIGNKRHTMLGCEGPIENNEILYLS